jgi:hypothetical protein
MYLEKKISMAWRLVNAENSPSYFQDQSHDAHNSLLSHLLRVDRTELQHRHAMTICWIWPDNEPLPVDKSGEVSITRNAVAAALTP